MKFDTPKAFVAMSYEKSYDDLFHLGIEAALLETGIECVRIDQQTFTGSILDKIKTEISKSSIVVAEISSANPNVFLEIGYAWGCNCPTILLSKQGDEPPFDVRGQKCIFYETITNLKSALKLELERLKVEGLLGLEKSIEIYVGDITNLEVDAVVNAANEQLIGGSGVNGAMHRRAGPALQEACQNIPEVRAGIRCPTGEARITEGFALPAKYIIHTAGPIYQGGSSSEDKQLASCYTQSLELAAQYSLDTIAFPAISTGVYGYPKDKAAKVAVSTVRGWMRQNKLPRKVVFCCFEHSDFPYYDEAIKE